jgi:hypothetical protein
MQTAQARAICDPASAFYHDALTRLSEADIPYLIGGAFAFAEYAKIARDTKDLDVFLRRGDCRRALALLDQAGYRTELPFPHWLGKVHGNGHWMDVIFSSGNGIAAVDDLWFDHAAETDIFGLRVRLCPAEEMIWSKAFVQERERFDGADVLHLIRALGRSLDWRRLVMRFADHWRVLFGHVVLFGYVYPDHRDDIPQWVVEELAGRLAADCQEAANRLCYGTLLSREQYLIDVGQRGYRDPRIEPHGPMTREETDVWTAAIEETKGR